MSLPDYFCWTRIGTEAGEPISHILERKERERVANAGVFVWGIGNAVGPSVRELVQRSSRPEVLFSPIKSPAKRQDVSPSAIAAWTWGETLDGDAFRLPEHSLVTSRYDPGVPGKGHYALVCFSRSPIVPSQSEEEIVFSALRNVRTGRPIGASQVTAVVLHCRSYPRKTLIYEVAIRAELVHPYFIRLRQPVVLLNSAGADLRQDWASSALQLIRQQRHESRPSQLSIQLGP